MSDETKDGGLLDALAEGALLAMSAADKAKGSAKAYYKRIAKTLHDHETKIRVEATRRPHVSPHDPDR